MKRKHPKALGNDVVIDIFHYLSRDELDGLRLTCREFNRVVRAHFASKPFRLVQRIACYTGLIDPDIDEKAIHIEQLGADIQGRAIRAQTCALHIGVTSSDDLDDPDHFFEGYRTGTLESTQIFKSNIGNVYRSLEKNLPLIIPLWRDSKLEIIFHFLLVQEDESEDDHIDFIRWFDVDNALYEEGENSVTKTLRILFDDSHEQNFGALLEKCAELKIHEFGGSGFYAPFEELHALHMCKKLEFPDAFVCPIKLAKFLIADDRFPLRFLTVGLYCMDDFDESDGRIKQMTKILKEEFHHSEKPHAAYRCWIHLQEVSEVNLPFADRITNNTTDEYFSIEKVSENVFVITRCAQKDWDSIVGSN